MEAHLRQKLIRMSCAKLIAVRKTDDALRRSLHVLAVLRHAHSEDAKFYPECASLLMPRQSERLVVTLSPAPPQRIPLVPQQVTPTPADVDMDEGPVDEDDGGSMARKRKPAPPTTGEVSREQKRHCDCN